MERKVWSSLSLKSEFGRNRSKENLEQCYKILPEQEHIWSKNSLEIPSFFLFFFFFSVILLSLMIVSSSNVTWKTKTLWKISGHNWEYRKAS